MATDKGLTPEQLLKPRFKVIADYPNNIHKVGSIILTEDEAPFDRIKYYRCVEYPNIFKPLAWYEEREASEMPEYLRSVKQTDAWNPFNVGSVVEVISYTNDNGMFNQFGNPSSYFLTKHFQPATETEYQNYLKQKL